MLVINITLKDVMLILIIVFLLVIIAVGMVLSVMFQKKSKKKLEEVEKIVKSKEGEFFQAKTSLNEKEILKVNPELDINKFMNDLFKTFVKLEDKLNKHDDTDIESLAYGTQVNYVKNKVNSYKSNGFCEINDDIDLISSAIIEMTKTKVVLRVIVECLNYKMLDDKIVSGNKTTKKKEIILIEYKLHDDKWLITDIDKVSEEKAGR